MTSLLLCTIIALVAISNGFEYTFYNDVGDVILYHQPYSCLPLPPQSPQMWTNYTSTCKDSVSGDDFVFIDPVMNPPYLVIYDCVVSNNYIVLGDCYSDFIRLCDLEEYIHMLTDEGICLA